MTRFRIGIILLLCLLALSLGAQWAAEAICAPIAQALTEAAAAALMDDWPAAAEQLTGAAARWRRYWRFTAALADHQPMEDIDCLFAQLTLGLQTHSEDFAPLAADLSRRIAAVSAAQTLTWWNFL